MFKFKRRAARAFASKEDAYRGRPVEGRG